MENTRFNTGGNLVFFWSVEGLKNWHIGWSPGKTLGTYVWGINLRYNPPGTTATPNDVDVVMLTGHLWNPGISNMLGESLGK